MKKKILKTGDGSPSFIIDELHETYHSRHGAITESLHVYINKGLASWIEKNKKKEVSIFEMGLGTGLNAYLAFCFCIKNKIKLNYYTVEKYPLSIKEIMTLEMEKYLPYPEFHKFFKQLHSSDWNINISYEDIFFQKSNSDFFDSTINNKYNIIFFDAFGFNAQPEMWGEKALEICYRILKPYGSWISYCSKGSVRRCLDKLGFKVDRLEGPPGKLEILRAIKTV
tara:strand:+ start:678 stop:1352 length:675 start_codon:yes stop_codon:yes gene_type:complete